MKRPKHCAAANWGRCSSKLLAIDYETQMHSWMVDKDEEDSDDDGAVAAAGGAAADAYAR